MGIPNTTVQLLICLAKNKEFTDVCPGKISHDYHVLIGIIQLRI